MNITVIGLGYVGLVTSACFAELGHVVQGIDIDLEKIKMLKEGQMPLYEPGLRELISKNNMEGRLLFTHTFSKDIGNSLLIFIAVGTPSKSNGIPDLSAVYNSLDAIIPFVKSYKVFVLKSTVPVGTTAKIKEYLSKKLTCEFDVVSNPEFLKEGNAVQDFMKPDRIVVGVDNIKSAEIMKELYSHFTRNNHPILIMDSMSSEVTKYASNLMLALKVSFINEIAILCDAIGADIRRVREGIISDPRIGGQFLYPSIGFGGSCLPKDVQALRYISNEKSLDLLIPDTTLKVNEKQSDWFLNKIIKYFGEENIKNKTFALWGVSFKAGTDDIRESPALEVIEGLGKCSAKLKLYDPIALKNAKKHISALGISDKVEFSKNELDSVQGADALVVCTEWLQFRSPNFEKLASALKDKVIFDGRNLYDPDKLRLYGLNHVGIGVSNLRKETKSTKHKSRS